MIYEQSLRAYTSFFPPGTSNPTHPANKPTNIADNEPPKRPDWLLIFVAILFLISLLIVWLVDIPGLLD